jgi:UDP-glucuronate 4-epimerase
VVLVTGVAGFIGSHVARALLARGQDVVGVDNFDPFYPKAAKARALQSVVDAARPEPSGLTSSERSGPAARGRFRFVELDLCDTSALRAVFEQAGAAVAGAGAGGAGRIEGVIHLAAKAGVRPSVDDPVAYARANLLATSVVLDESRRAGVARVVVASSSSVYGNAERVPFDEEQDVGRPISPYAATKRACELLGYTHWHLTRTPVAMLRFFTVFGPGQRPDLAISTFLRAARRGEAIRAFGSPESSRDYTYIDDIVSGVVAAYDRIDTHGYRVWNLGGNRPVTLGEMIRVVGRVSGRELQVSWQAGRVGDVERTFADLTRSRSELGYEPRVGFEAGVARQWAWLVEQPE